MAAGAGTGEHLSLLRTPAGDVRVLWRVLAFLLLAVAIALLTGLLLPAGMQGGAVGLLVGSLVAGWVLLASHHRRRPQALGFYLGRGALTDTAKGLGLGVLVALAVVVAMAAAGGLAWSSQPGSATGWLAEGGRAAAFLAVPAAAEEAFMRGYPLQALAQAWGPGWALLATSAAFGVLHLGNPDVTALAALNVAAAGAFLGVVYLRTASLWWATGAHLGWNWCHGFLADVPVSGLELIDAPLYEGRTAGPDWLGGGGFGPEGSALATVVVLGATMACWRAGWLGPAPAATAAGPLYLPTAPGSERES